MRRLKFFLLILLGGPASVWGQDPSPFPDPARLDEVARSRGWRALLHYRAPFLRGERSDVDSESFFLSPEGARDLRAELEATVRVFVDPARARTKHGTMGQPAACAFPARREFLRRELGEAFAKRLVPIDCADFEEWRKGIEARGVSLVFSSAYPNNPASMFGHTFLRLDRAASGETPPGISKRMDLLSYGADFSASVPDGENPVKYAMWGLFGGYRGRYDLSPYYRKVNDYAFSESRDLWEYRLSLSVEESAQLVRHLWELYADGFFDYYFLDENCSFQILTALEAVKPEWDLSSGFVLSVLPVETVKRLVRTTGAVVDVAYRPSLKNEMEAALERLPNEERVRVREVYLADERKSAESVASLLASASTSALDALISVLAYEKARASGEEGRGELLRTVLVERSRRGKHADTVDPSIRERERIGERPDRSHRSSRVSIAGGTRAERATAEVSLYGLRHDLLDRTPSYNLFSEVRLLGFEVEKAEGRNVRFERADIIGMGSFSPHSVFDPQHSWRVEAGWERIGDLPDTSAGAWQAAGGYGRGWNTFGPRHLAYALLSGEAERSGAFRRSFRFSPGLDLGWVLNPAPEKLFFHLRGRGYWDAFGAVPERRLRLRSSMEISYWIASEWNLRTNLALDSRTRGSRLWAPGAELELAFRF